MKVHVQEINIKVDILFQEIEVEKSIFLFLTPSFCYILDNLDKLISSDTLFFSLFIGIS